jgi:hypothetical protein
MLGPERACPNPVQRSPACASLAGGGRRGGAYRRRPHGERRTNPLAGLSAGQVRSARAGNEGWALPQVCKPGLRLHVYLGAIRREDAHEVFAYWQDARRGTVERVAHHEGRLAGGIIEAPIAVYRHDMRRGDRGYLFIQHGSYQFVPVDEQPELEEGYVHMHRGIGDAKAFRWGSFRTGTESRHTRTWEEYARLQFDVLSRSDLSFNSIHDRAKRAEASHIRDDTWMTDALATERNLHIEHDAWTHALWDAAHQRFALRRWVSENKFGPHRVVCRTPLTNIRITTVFAGAS